MLSILRHLSVTAVLIWIEKLWFVYCWSGKLIAWYVDAFLACKEGGYREKWRASGTRNETEERGAGLPLTRINYLPSNKVDIVRSHAQVARFRRHESEGWVCHLLGRSLFSPQARRYREKSHARGTFKETEERGAGFPLTRITYLPYHLLGRSLFSHEYHSVRQTKWRACSQFNVYSEMPSLSYRLS